MQLEKDDDHCLICCSSPSNDLEVRPSCGTNLTPLGWAGRKSFSMMHGTEQESTDEETTLRMFRSLGSGSTPGKIYKKSPALNGSRRRSDSNELGSFPQKYLRIYKRLAKSGRTDSSAPPAMPEPDYMDNVEDTPSPDCDEAKFGLDSGLESESSSSSCTGFNTSELDGSAVPCRWQLPSSSLYNEEKVNYERLFISRCHHRLE
ncbi:hypothetical protein Tsp_01186 [Trichinella spiralis]|uniref:hypothetical protein n=1 Tax=Trichinella spiralis TaxID=6334 RepID=UPI0001EFC66B|nr:hypothetical protein Tsp_01186 [Trichinella spiralis]